MEPILDIFPKKKSKEKPKELLHIIVDKREKNSLVYSYLIENEVNPEFKMLKVADYIVGSIGIERKTISDFISSMINKRLFKQLHELKQYPKQLLIIEGYEEKDFYENSFNENVIRGMVLSVILEYRIPVIFTKNSEDTAKYLKSLAKRENKPNKEIGLKFKKKVYSKNEMLQLIIEGFPGIGPNLAKELLRKFKTLKNIINADIAELSKIKKLGNKKAKLIKEITGMRYSD
ncbi:hypothetical protein AUJ10_02520 [Candidatus Pacearchaeota archaeon CG1_02_31_27]|nr:MAG: hypothetical protein AUJ10_02520 [Candidatus Pacearchaeota archaeon CG1_02_31_27]PIN92477.1 MAG: hypothetical protein COU55_01585 [Candidatus Pacearchaeota archaeon CG10_big_fil_rev_8_21_14_0_10_31_59]PIZ80957.1 MAG: hypothetical protein COX99_01295 [Candidatus Pacearchaeota archaeon CG_4_10_14_0_2_um_filter_31_10]